MLSTTFVKTRWNYDSYTDFWSLVHLSGFPTCYVDEIDLTLPMLYIVSPMNGEIPQRFGDGIKDSRAVVVLWNLERPSNPGGVVEFVKANYELGRYFQKVLLSDRQLTIECNNVIQSSDFFRYVPIGVHEHLGQPGKFEEKKYDFIHLSCYSNRRSRLFITPSEPKREYRGCAIAPNGWGSARREALQKTRYMYCVHQDDFQYIEPLRYTLAAAYGLPIIAEFSVDPYPYTPYVTYVTDDDIGVYSHNYNNIMYMHGIAFRNYMLEYFHFQNIINDLQRSFS